VNSTDINLGALSPIGDHVFWSSISGTFGIQTHLQ